MNEVIRAAVDLQALCEEQRWRFCVIGGLAVLRWGEARETVDVEVTLLTGFGSEKPFIDLLTRIDNAVEFALTNRVLTSAEIGRSKPTRLFSIPWQAFVSGVP